MSNSVGLRVGAGRADITPEKGILLAGDIGRQRFMEEVKAPLFADVVVFESAGQTACFVSTPPTNVNRPCTDPLRQECAEILGT